MADSLIIILPLVGICLWLLHRIGEMKNSHAADCSSLEKKLSAALANVAEAQIQLRAAERKNLLLTGELEGVRSSFTLAGKHCHKLENDKRALQAQLAQADQALEQMVRMQRKQVARTVSIYSGTAPRAADKQALPDLTTEQAMVLDAIKEGGNFFIQGRAGTGKSTLLAHVRAAFEKKGRRVRTVCPTGIAALNVGGFTIHSLFHFPARDIFYLPKMSVSEGTRQLLQNTDLLIVDEVSMVRPDMLDAMDKFARQARKFSEPFGGMQVVLVGDLLQMPPVIMQGVSERFKQQYGHAAPRFFDAKVFGRCKFQPILLRQIHRQQEDALLQRLDDVRQGKNMDMALEYFGRLKIRDDNLRENSVLLCPTREGAATHNSKKLRELSGPLWEYPCRILGRFGTSASGEEEQRFPAPALLRLKVGALVIVLCNLDADCVNGSSAVVMDLDKDIITIKLLESGRIVPIALHTWEQEGYDDDDNMTVIGKFVQFPLQLGYAMTIHKAQGKTLNSVQLRLAGAFSAGQAYVALSRTRRAADMHVSSIIKKSVIVDYRVVSFLEERGLL